MSKSAKFIFALIWNQKIEKKLKKISNEIFALNLEFVELVLDFVLLIKLLEISQEAFSNKDLKKDKANNIKII